MSWSRGYRGRKGWSCGSGPHLCPGQHDGFRADQQEASPRVTAYELPVAAALAGVAGITGASVATDAAKRTCTALSSLTTSEFDSSGGRGRRRPAKEPVIIRAGRLPQPRSLRLCPRGLWVPTNYPAVQPSTRGFRPTSPGGQPPASPPNKHVSRVAGCFPKLRSRRPCLRWTTAVPPVSNARERLSVPTLHR